MSIYGADIAYVNNELQLVTNGDVMLVHDEDTVIQDIFLRLSTPYGSLFYDKSFGSYLYQFIKEEDLQAVRFALCDEVARRIEDDPRVALGSAHAFIASYTDSSLTLKLSFSLRTTDTYYNLILSLDKHTEEMHLDGYL